MPDYFSQVPLDIYGLKRMRGATFAEVAGFTVLMHLADDWGRFDADWEALAHRLWAPASETESVMNALHKRGMFRMWMTPEKNGEDRRQIGEIVGWDDFSHGKRKQYEDERCGSAFPNEDGSVIYGKHVRSKAKKTEAESEPVPDFDENDNMVAPDPEPPKPSRAPAKEARRKSEKRGDKNATEEKRQDQSRQEQTRPDARAREETPAGVAGLPADLTDVAKEDEAPKDDGAQPAEKPSRHRDAIAARDLWLRTIAARAPLFNIEDDMLHRIADQWGVEVFSLAVDLHIEAEPKWWQKKPIEMLRLRCQWAKERLDKRAAGGGNGGSAGGGGPKNNGAHLTPRYWDSPVTPSKPVAKEPRPAVPSPAWDAAFEALRLTVPPTGFRDFIKTLVCVGDDGKTLTLAAVDETNVAWTMGNFMPQIVEACAPMAVDLIPRPWS